MYGLQSQGHNYLPVISLLKNENVCQMGQKLAQSLKTTNLGLGMLQWVMDRLYSFHLEGKPRTFFTPFSFYVIVGCLTLIRGDTLQTKPYLQMYVFRILYFIKKEYLSKNLLLSWETKYIFMKMYYRKISICSLRIHAAAVSDKMS